MSRTVRVILGLVVLVVLVGVGVFAYIYISGGSGEASAPISAPTLELVSAAEASVPTTTPTVEATEDSMAATAEATTDAAAAASSTSGLTVFNIDSTQSQVSFTLTEELRSVPTTVVGTTDQVAGQIAVDFSDPKTTAQVGEIRINARTLATDQDMRNRTIRGQILQSSQDQYEFITFQPTAISGLPDSITVGEPVTFQITGDLTIRDITQSVTFDVTATPDSDTQITGKATTTVQRSDFDLNIPSVPQVANVSEDVQLQIDFVATAGS